MDRADKKIVIRRLKPKEAKAASLLMKKVLAELTMYSKESRDAETDFYYTPRKMAKEMKDRMSLLVGAFDDGRLIGLIFAFISIGGLAYIDWLLVDRAHRRIGIGQRLVAYIELISKKRGMHKIWCDTEMRNKKSIIFFKKLRYKKVAALKDWEAHEDRYLWAKGL